MVQELDSVDMGTKQALLARQLLGQLTHLEDKDRSELVVVVVMEQDYVLLDSFLMAVEQVLQLMQPLAQLMHLEDEDK